MPAYFKAAEPIRCGYPGCKKWAAGSVYNTVNAKVGDYCKAHGDQTVKEMNSA